MTDAPAIPPGRPTARRLAAARGVLSDFDEQVTATMHGQRSEPDWMTWAKRLAGTASSVTDLADQLNDDLVRTRGRSTELAALLEHAMTANKELAALLSPGQAAAVLGEDGSDAPR